LGRGRSPLRFGRGIEDALQGLRLGPIEPVGLVT
jgi:hypothetical protein